jgi:predicted kinase
MTTELPSPIAVTPDDQLLDSIKKQGVQTALANEIRSRLVTAKAACIDASNSDLKDFRRKIELAKESIRQAEVIYREWYQS